MSGIPNINKRGYDTGSYVKIVGIDNEVLAGITTDNNTLSETILSQVDKSNGTISRIIIPFDGYKYMSTHVKITSGSANDTVTMTLWGTNNEGATNLSDTDWVDITEDEWLVASKVINNTTFEHIYIIDLPLVMNRLMIKFVYAYTGGIAASNSTEVYVKKSS
jgi:hypothetical protein